MNNENVNNKKNSNENIIKCPDCQKEVSKNARVCPHCGCPISSKVIPPKKHILIIVIVAILIITLGALISIVLINRKNQAEIKNYQKRLQSTTNLINESVTLTQKCGDLTLKVWSNAINKTNDDATDPYTLDSQIEEGATFEEVWEYIGKDHFYDFNTALSNLYSDTNFSKDVKQIQTTQKQIEEEIKQLANPPEKYKQAYESAKEYYDAYLDLTILVTDTSGSLQTWSSNYNNAVADAKNCLKKMQTYALE